MTEDKIEEASLLQKLLCPRFCKHQSELALWHMWLGATLAICLVVLYSLLWMGLQQLIDYLAGVPVIPSLLVGLLWLYTLVGLIVASCACLMALFWAALPILLSIKYSSRRLSKKRKG